MGSIPFRFYWNQKQPKCFHGVWHYIWIYVPIFLLLSMTRVSLMLWSPSGPSCIEIRAPFIVNMPSATITAEVDYAPVITIGRGSVALDKNVLGQIDKSAALQKDTLDRLQEGLESLKREHYTLHPNRPFPAKVVIAADKDIQFVLIRQILEVCTSTGYEFIDLAVFPAAHHPWLLQGI